VIPASARPLLVATALQSALAAALVARGAVAFARAPLADALGVVTGAALGYLLYRGLSLRDAPSRQPASAGAIAGFALAYAAIAVAEEILWRGWAFDVLAASRGALVALIVTTAGFALAHGIHQGFAGVRFHLVTGLAFALTLLATSSLAAAAAAHAAYNLALYFAGVSLRKKAFHDPLAVG
jgi:membrane protease YdiL (CAAX protease family)